MEQKDSLWLVVTLTDHNMMMEHFNEVMESPEKREELRQQALAFQKNESEANKQKAFLRYYGKSEELPTQPYLSR